MMKTSPYTEPRQRIAMFPGSFDPFTRGHESVVRRALALFDEVVIAIGVNADKKGLLTPQQRKALIESVFQGDECVRVCIYDQLTVDFARQCGAQFLLRGVRSVLDFENEKTLAEVNRQLAGIETVLLYTLPQDGHVSSSIVRELLRYGQDVKPLLPAAADFSIIQAALAK